MYPLPTPERLGFLIGARLDSITIAEFVVDFAFDGGAGITLEARFSVADPSGAETPHDAQTIKLAKVGFQRLIGETVARVLVFEDALVLGLSGGYQLRILSESQPFERGRIRGPAGSGLEFII